jgi:hypothetical protein
MASELPDEAAFKPPLKRAEQNVDPHASSDKQHDLGKRHAWDQWTRSPHQLVVL